MATLRSYNPPVVDHEPGRAQVDDFVRALDESGLLRALTGAIRAYPELAAQVVRRLDPDDATAFAALLGTLELPDPDTAHRFATSVRAARSAARNTVTAREAPSLPALIKALADPDVRRGLGAVLSGLRAFGGAMARPDEASGSSS